MDWVGVGVCMIGAMLAITLISISEEEEFEEELDEEGITINDPSNKSVILSCQTCRKLKKHKEIEPYLFQCAKCKRHVDLRRAS
jgi:acetyl-CoA carboxylase beta subunit